jgi:hypothetical protein
VDRSIQKLIKNKSLMKNCIHTKNIYSLLDLPKKDETYKKMTKHLESCEVCDREFKLFQLKSAAAQVFIPKVIMDRDLKQSFEREVSELFKVMNLNNREILKNNVRSGFSILDNMGISFLQNLYSRTMVKSYFFAFAIFLVLKFLL